MPGVVLQSSNGELKTSAGPSNNDACNIFPRQRKLTHKVGQSS